MVDSVIIINSLLTTTSLSSPREKASDDGIESVFSKISKIVTEFDCMTVGMDYVEEHLTPFNKMHLLKAAEQFRSDTDEFQLVRRLWEHKYGPVSRVVRQ